MLNYFVVAWLVSFIIFHQRSVKRFLGRWMIPPKGQMMMVQQLVANDGSQCITSISMCSFFTDQSLPSRCHAHHFHILIPNVWFGALMSIHFLVSFERAETRRSTTVVVRPRRRVWTWQVDRSGCHSPSRGHLSLPMPPRQTQNRPDFAMTNKYNDVSIIRFLLTFFAVLMSLWRHKPFSALPDSR